MKTLDKMRIFFLDAGRKYFGVEAICKMLDAMAQAGLTHLQLYFSDNQGFRFALRDMTLTTAFGTYDLAAALGDGYAEGDKATDGSGKYLTETDMEAIFHHAASKNIHIIPVLNMPGHLGTILMQFPQLRYAGSKSSIDLANPEAVAFALGLLEKYAAYFAGLGCKYFNFGCDEYANDRDTMGFDRIYKDGGMKLFVSFINQAAAIVKAAGMTPMCFNDGLYYNNDADTYGAIDTDLMICHWSHGWNGYDLATPEMLAAQGFRLINTNSTYYWVLGRSDWQLGCEKALQFDETEFEGGHSVKDPAGSMLCVWCDLANADGLDEGAGVAKKIAPVMQAFGQALKK